MRPSLGHIDQRKRVAGTEVPARDRRDTAEVPTEEPNVGPIAEVAADAMRMQPT